MSVLPDAVHLHFGDTIGTFEFEWLTDEIECGDATFPLMHHLPTQASFVIGHDDAPPDGALSRYALLVANGSVAPEDRTAIVYLGRAAVWYHVQQMPQIQAILNEPVSDEPVPDRPVSREQGSERRMFFPATVNPPNQ